MDRSFLRNNIYCMDNIADDGSPIEESTSCVTTFSGDKPFYYPAPIAEAATECGFKYFLAPDNRGFALNFDKIKSIHKIYIVEDNQGRISVSIPTHDLRSTPPEKYLKLSLTGVPLVNGGSLVVFKERFILLLPFSPFQIRRLKFASTDPRDQMKKVNGPQQLGPEP